MQEGRASAYWQAGRNPRQFRPRQKAADIAPNKAGTSQTLESPDAQTIAPNYDIRLLATHTAKGTLPTSASPHTATHPPRPSCDTHCPLWCRPRAYTTPLSIFWPPKSRPQVSHVQASRIGRGWSRFPNLWLTSNREQQAGPSQAQQ